jgi:hypothetical protein
MLTGWVLRPVGRNGEETDVHYIVNTDLKGQVRSFPHEHIQQLTLIVLVSSRTAHCIHAFRVLFDAALPPDCTWDYF